MAEYTENYNLEKPADNEWADIANINQNMDKIDTAIKAVDTAAGAAQTAANNAGTAAAAVQASLNSHLSESMPHKFTSDTKTYKWGLSTVNGVIRFNYEEVI